MTLPRRIVAEGLGTALLLCAVVGSGIMGERLTDGNLAIALLANSVSTGAALVVLVPDVCGSATSAAAFSTLPRAADSSGNRRVRRERIHTRDEARKNAAPLLSGSILSTASVIVSRFSEQESHPELRDSRATHGVRDGPEVHAVEVVLGHPEVHRVEHVEHFPPQLGLQAPIEPNRLGDA